MNEALARRGIDAAGVIGELGNYITRERPDKPTAAEFHLFFVKVTNKFKARSTADEWALIVRTCAALYFDLGRTAGDAFNLEQHVRAARKKKPAVNSIVYELSLVLGALPMKLRVSRYKAPAEDEEDVVDEDIDEVRAREAEVDFVRSKTDDIVGTLGSILEFDMFDIVKLAFKGKGVSVLDAPMRCVL